MGLQEGIDFRLALRSKSVGGYGQRPFGTNCQITHRALNMQAILSKYLLWTS